VLPADGCARRRAGTTPHRFAYSSDPEAGQWNGHFQFDFPIQPDEAEKDTLFQLGYHVAYSGTYTFHPQIQLPADNVAVLLPLSIKFKASQALRTSRCSRTREFNPVGEDVTRGKPWTLRCSEPVDAS